MPPRPIRRVVTGHDADGRAVLISDGPAPAVHHRGPGTSSVIELWETRQTPADNSGNSDCTIGQPMRIPPEKNGSKFRVVEFPPDSQRVWTPLAATGVAHDAGARHPGFHKTNTVDYAIVLDGEIYAMMDVGETLLKPGDVLIQRGTNHAWSNRSDGPCRIAFVVIDAEPA
jgi:hypothetical protein